jgi:hypothetical protein
MSGPEKDGDMQRQRREYVIEERKNKGCDEKIETCSYGWC